MRGIGAFLLLVAVLFVLAGLAARGGRRVRSGSVAGVDVPGPAAACLLLVGLAAFFTLTGSYLPEALPAYARSPQMFTGMALMLTLLPPYLLLAAHLAQRRSLAAVRALRAELGDRRVPAAVDREIAGGLRRSYRLALPVGLVLGLFNTNPTAAFRGEEPLLEGAISVGQLLLWTSVGLLGGVRFVSARVFRRLGAAAPGTLFQPAADRWLARPGLDDVAIVAGALLFTPLQSLDAQFRWYNYSFGLGVALPSMAFFLLWPLLPRVRARRAERGRRLALLDRAVAEIEPRAAREDADPWPLEALLAHRDRLARVSPWPVGGAGMVRAFAYLLLAPLGWVAAAVVEWLVERLLGA